VVERAGTTRGEDERPRSGGGERSVVVAVVFVGAVKPAVNQVVDVIPVRNGVVPAAVAVGVRRIAVDRIGVLAGVGLIDGDHVFVDVLLVGVVQMAVMEVVDVIVVPHCRMAAARSVLVRMGAFMDLVGHAFTLGRVASFRKRIPARLLHEARSSSWLLRITIDIS
jgi:hypothetical protein